MKLNGKEYIKKESVNCTGCAFKDKSECEEVYRKYNCSGFIFKRIIRVEKLVLTPEPAIDGCVCCHLESLKEACDTVNYKDVTFKMHENPIEEEFAKTEYCKDQAKLTEDGLIRVKEKFVDSCRECFFFDGDKSCEQSEEFKDECSDTHTIIAKTVRIRER